MPRRSGRTARYAAAPAPSAADGQNLFDFVHVRNLVQSITRWDVLLAEAFRCCRPGGYIELSEAGGLLLSDDNTTDPRTNAFKRVYDLVSLEALPRIGRPPATEQLLAARLAAAGFVDVRARSFKQPFGPW